MKANPVDDFVLLTQPRASDASDENGISEGTSNGAKGKDKSKHVTFAFNVDFFP